MVTSKKMETGVRYILQKLPSFKLKCILTWNNGAENYKIHTLGLLRGLDDSPVDAPLTERDLWKTPKNKACQSQSGKRGFKVKQL